MQLKSLFLSFLLGLALSCTSRPNLKLSCDFDSLYLKGVKDGEDGLNFSDSLVKMCARQDKAFVKNTYLKGQKKGLKNFCTFERGQDRALMKIDSEPLCASYDNYNEGFMLSLENHCSEELATMDGKSLTPSNLNCFESPHYKKAFFLEVNRVCNKKMVYQQGLKNVPLSPYCLRLDNKTELKISYDLGLQSHNIHEATELQKKAEKLSKKLKVLKQIKPNSDSEKVTINKRIEKISKEFLKTKHALEQKKSKL